MSTERNQALFDESWKIIQLMKRQYDDSQTQFGIVEGYTRVYNILQQIQPDPQLDLEDIQEFFFPIVLHLGKYIKDITRTELEEAVKSYLLASPKIYDYYFRIGTLYEFASGTEVGTSKLYPFDDLPVKNRRKLSEEWVEFERKGIKKENLAKQWFMHIEARASGQSRAKSIAITELRKNINILKFVYWHEPSIFVSNESSPFDFTFSTTASEVAYFGEGKRQKPPTIVGYESGNAELKQLNKIIQKPQKTEIEQGISNAIEMVGIADTNTPTHTRFVLCIMALEGMLLSEKDNVGAKLAERVSYLIGDSEEWKRAFRQYLPHLNIKLNDSIKDETLLARASLNNYSLR